jgi:hypothetical protein
MNEQFLRYRFLLAFKSLQFMHIHVKGLKRVSERIFRLVHKLSHQPQDMCSLVDRQFNPPSPPIMHSKLNLRSSTISYVLIDITFTSGDIDVDNGRRILNTIEFVTNIHSNTKNKKQCEIIRGK